MNKPSEYINNICSECNPRTYDMTIAKFTGEEQVMEVVDRDGNYSFTEYLYECCECGEKNLVDDQWINRNTVTKKEVSI